MNTSEFAKLCGVEKRTLFHYDAIGLLKPDRVRENGYREYSMEQLGLMDMIKIFQACGYTLSEIGEIITHGECAKRNHMQDAMDRIDARISQLQQMKRYLQSKQQLFEEYLAHPAGTCQIQSLSLRQERKAVSSDRHFFSFLRDGTYSTFLLDENGNCFICRASESGSYPVNGTAISFFLEIPAQEDRLPQRIRQELNRFGFSGESNYFLESLPHFLLEDPKKAVLKVTVLEKTESRPPAKPVACTGPIRA